MNSGDLSFWKFRIIFLFLLNFQKTISEDDWNDLGISG